MRSVLMHSIVPTNGETVTVWTLWTPTLTGGGPQPQVYTHLPNNSSPLFAGFENVWRASSWARSGLINRRCLDGHWGPIPPPSAQTRLKPRPAKNSSRACCLYCRRAISQAWRTASSRPPALISAHMASISLPANLLHSSQPAICVLYLNCARIRKGPQGRIRARHPRTAEHAPDANGRYTAQATGEGDAAQIQ
jgi:hypothetical protein